MHGRDLFGLAAPTVASLGCRVYPDGLPDEAAIAAVLRMSVDPYGATKRALAPRNMSCMTRINVGDQAPR